MFFLDSGHVTHNLEIYRSGQSIRGTPVKPVALEVHSFSIVKEMTSLTKSHHNEDGNSYLSS